MAINLLGFIIIHKFVTFSLLLYASFYFSPKANPFFFLAVIVNGNFTDEEVDNRIVFPPEEHGLSKEYPLQRDEVQTTPSRDDRKQHIGTFSKGGKKIP